MAMTINTNVVSINAQRNLSLSGNSLGTTMQRLSSGLRVNSAKDDAAGLAIAERMNAQSKGLAVAARNANDGISLAQTAEGALGKVGDMLQRMRELAVQSSNATNSADDRKALQAEVNQLRSEIDRVAKTTSFNGQKILDGSFSGGVFQVGAGAGDNITVGAITNAKATSLSNVTFGSSTSTVKASDISNLEAIKSGTLKIQVGTETAIDLGEIAEANSGQERLGQVVAAINAKTADTGVTAFLVEGKNAGEYSVELRSSSEKGVSLTGFSTATTGVGRAADVGFSDTATAAYKALTSKIDALLADDKTSLANTGASDKLGLDDIKTIFTDAGALSTAHLTSTRATALGTTALGAFTTTVIAQGVKTPSDGTNAAVAATTVAELTAWNTTSNQTAQNGSADDTDTPASLAAVKTALTELKTALTTQWEAQQTSNLSAVETAFQDALKTTSGDAFEAAINDTGKLNATLAAVGLKELALPKLDANSKPEELQAAKEMLVANYNEQLSSGFGVAATEVKEHKGIEGLDISTQAGAWEALSSIDSAIDQVNAARADLGALQTRFEKTIENIDIMNENISAARGRIVDADFAKETANLSRSQILQQAGTAMVAQANQLSQGVLSLLQ